MSIKKLYNTTVLQLSLLINYDNTKLKIISHRSFVLSDSTSVLDGIS